MASKTFHGVLRNFTRTKVMILEEQSNFSQFSKLIIVK